CSSLILCVAAPRYVTIFLVFLHHLFHLNFLLLFCFFFNTPPPTENYTLSLHDALPIYGARQEDLRGRGAPWSRPDPEDHRQIHRSEEHTSELQSPDHLVCRLLLEKKKKNK